MRIDRTVGMDLRFRLFLIVGMALLVGAVWTLPQWWVLMNPESVLAEEMPGLPRSVQEQFVKLSNTEKDAYMMLYQGEEDLEMEAEPDWARALVEARFLTEDTTVEATAEPFVLPDGSLVIATGEFVGVDVVRSARGEITIYQLPDGSRLLRFSDDFNSVRAPDVRIILTRNPDPMDTRGVGVDYLEIAKLKANRGAQTYTVPEVADFSRYPIMALYSPQYDGLVAILTIR